MKEARMIDEVRQLTQSKCSINLKASDGSHACMTTETRKADDVRKSNSGGCLGDFLCVASSKTVAARNSGAKAR